MKYLFAAVLLISSALSIPIGDIADEPKPELPLNKSEEVQSDVSHEHGSSKVEHDSRESSEDSGSSESGEKTPELALPKIGNDKPLLDEKVEHQAQPSEIVNSEVVHDSAKPVADAPVVPEQVPQADPQASEALERSNPLKAIDAILSAPVVEPAQPEVHQDEAKPSDEAPKTLPEPDAPAAKSLPVEQTLHPEIKQDVAVVQSEPLDVVQPKTLADAPELKEAAPEEPKLLDEPKPAEAPTILLPELEKPLEEKAKIALPLETIPADKAADPVPVQDEVVKDVVKPVQEVASDALPLPQPDEPVKDEPAKKEPEPETLPAKLSEASSSS